MFIYIYICCVFVGLDKYKVSLKFYFVVCN
jgi:hypothetical protein